MSHRPCSLVPFEECSDLFAENTVAVLPLAMDDKDFLIPVRNGSIQECLGRGEGLRNSVAVEIDRVVNSDLLRRLRSIGAEGKLGILVLNGVLVNGVGEVG